jgi:two-component system sensor histidine kinase/response regulator
MTTPTTAAPLHGIRILLAEDNQLNQLVARSLLEQAGALVDTADDGSAALRLLDSAAQRFDIVLMDVQMPGMDGLEATAAIRGPRALRLPVIAMSAGALASERALCTAAGMDDFLAKPLDIALLVACVLRHVAPRPQPQIDLAPLLKNQSAAQHKMLFDVVRRMLEPIPADLEQIRGALASAAPQQAAAVLHRLRGAIGSLGATSFVEAALALEAMIGKADQAHYAQALVRVERELARTGEAAAAWLADNAPPVPASDGDGDRRREALARLERLLAERDIDACGLLDELLPWFGRTRGPAFGTAMEQHMCVLDFEAALALLKA